MADKAPGTKRVTFKSKALSHFIRMPEKRVQNGDKIEIITRPPIQFRQGWFNTEDPEQIARVRSCSDFGRLIEEVDMEKLTRDRQINKEVSDLQPDAGELTEAVLTLRKAKAAKKAGATAASTDKSKEF